MSYVLKKFSVDESTEIKVDVQGRRGGLFSWLMNVIGLGATTSLSCTDEYVEFKAKSLAGFESVRVPTGAVTGVVFGLRKPIACFFFAAICLILAIAGFIAPVLVGLKPEVARYIPDGSLILTGVFFVIFAVIFIVAYFLGKMFYIGFENGGDKKHIISFRASVIEGVKVDSGKVESAATLINKLVLDARRK